MKKSKRRTNLKSSILVLLLIAILLIVSTYAWFTANRTVQVSQLDVNVATRNGLQISADASNWKSVLSVSDITSAAYTGVLNQIPTVLEPTSSVGDLDTDGHLKMYSGVVEADGDKSSDTYGQYLLTSALQSDVNGTGDAAGKYIAFDLYLKYQGDTPIYLTKSSNVVFTDAESKGLENAARVAFVVEGNLPDGSTPAAVQALKTNKPGDVYLWEPNNDTHTSTGVQNAASLYNVTTLTAGTGNTALAYDGILGPITAGIPLNKTTATANAASFKTVTPKIATAKTPATDTEMTGISSGLTKIRVYMWVEGQDVDCENSASGANLGFDLQFSMDKSE